MLTKCSRSPADSLLMFSVAGIKPSGKENRNASLIFSLTIHGLSNFDHLRYVDLFVVWDMQFDISDDQRSVHHIVLPVSDSRRNNTKAQWSSTARYVGLIVGTAFAIFALVNVTTSDDQISSGVAPNILCRTISWTKWV